MSGGDLFPDVQSILSPRLQWMRRHAVHCELSRRLRDQDMIDCWEAWQGDYKTAMERGIMAASEWGCNPHYNRYLMRAATEVEACERMGIENGWTLWHQEGIQ